MDYSSEFHELFIHELFWLCLSYPWSLYLKCCFVLILPSDLGINESTKIFLRSRGSKTPGVHGFVLPSTTFRLRVFDSGVMVIELQSHKEEEMVASALETVRGPGFLPPSLELAPRSPQCLAT